MSLRADPHELAGTILILGLGNPHRRDDAAGLEVVRRLEGRVPPEVRLARAPRDGARLLELWKDERWTIVVDAMRGAGAPGSVHRFEVDGRRSFPRTPATSTHGLGLAEAVELGRTIGQLPGRLTVFGIEAAELEIGDGLTPEVAQGVAIAADRICGIVEGSADGPGDRASEA